MILRPEQSDARDAVLAAFAAGARRVRLREGRGIAGGAVAAAVAVSWSGEPGLVLCPVPIQAQFRVLVRRLSPGTAIGDWGGGGVELATAVKAAVRGWERDPAAFVWIVAEECHPHDRERVRSALARFSSARVLEVVRGSGTGATAEADAEIAVGPGYHQPAGGPALPADRGDGIQGP